MKSASGRSRPSLNPVKQSEQNAAHALSELDDAWQRDKLEWSSPGRGQAPAPSAELEEKIQSLERALESKENAYADERLAQAVRLSEMESRSARSDKLVSACMQALILKFPSFTISFSAAFRMLRAITRLLPLNSPSPYLEESWIRWADRGSLVRRDITMLLGGFAAKKQLLESLREKIEEHRRDDRQQLVTAREESWQRWDERLGRLAEWKSSLAPLHQSSKRLAAWRDSTLWFDRVQTVGQRLADGLGSAADRLEKKIDVLSEKMNAWSSRLMAKEMELRDYVGQRTGTDLMISSARRAPYLDFLFHEREEEGLLARELKSIGGAAGRALKRLSRASPGRFKKPMPIPPILRSARTKCSPSRSPCSSAWRNCPDRP